MSEEAIERARAGVYPESIAADVSPSGSGGSSRGWTATTASARSSATAASSRGQDLTRDPPFSKLDLIVCRNVLIYLGPRLQRQLMSLFHYALKPSGFLMLGGAESVVRPRRSCSRSWTSGTRSTRTRGARARTDFEYRGHREIAADRRVADAARRGARPFTRASDVQSEVTRLLLGRYSPPGVVVDNELQIRADARPHRSVPRAPAGEAASTC